MYKNTIYSIKSMVIITNIGTKNTTNVKSGINKLLIVITTRTQIYLLVSQNWKFNNIKQANDVYFELENQSISYLVQVLCYDTTTLNLEDLNGVCGL